jgi:hypothetical protein
MGKAKTSIFLTSAGSDLGPETQAGLRSPGGGTFCLWHEMEPALRSLGAGHGLSQYGFNAGLSCAIGQ